MSTDQNFPSEQVLQRLAALQLAKELNNVSEACRQSNLDRTSFYKFKFRLEQQGLQGLENKSPAHHSHPWTTSIEIVERIIAVALANPTWGSGHISDYLHLETVPISSTTVYSILIQYSLQNRNARLQYLEELALKGINLTIEQIDLIEQANPQFSERHNESVRPGLFLVQDVIYAGNLRSIGPTYIHVVVDTYGSMSFCFVAIDKNPEFAVELLDKTVLPFYQERYLSIKTILTDNDREFRNTKHNPYIIYLRLNGIHNRRMDSIAQKNGFILRFRREIRKNLICPTLQKKHYTSVCEIQSDIDNWIIRYNTEISHTGYRNMGSTPIDMIDLYLLKNQCLEIEKSFY
jgi:hypothetical protein